MAEDEWIEQPDDGFIGYVGPILNKPFTDGIGHFRFISEKRHSNRAGYVQGGMLMTFADRAMGVTARQHDMGRNHVTIQLDMHFMSAVAIGCTVDIYCKIVKSTRTLVFVQGDICVDGEIGAVAHGIFKVLSQRSLRGES
jgi:uncharacterized protein (TIGR00369 family)